MNLRSILLASLSSMFAVTASAQQPVLFYDFTPDGVNVNNLGTNGTDGVLVGGATLSVDGIRGNVLTLDGNDGSYVNTQLDAPTLGFSTDNYTAGAFVRVNDFVGDNMVFGQLNVGDRWLHNGLRGNKPHMGHWGADTTGTTDLDVTPGPNNWFHLAFRYMGDEQTIFVNGAVAARSFQGNLTNTSNILVGSSAGGGLPGALDDVAVYNSSLRANQIEFLAAGGNPTALPAPGISNQGYLGAIGSLSPTTVPQGPSVQGGSGQWAIREVKSGNATPDNLPQAIDVLKNPPAGSTVADGFTSVINRRDPEAGASHLFTGDTPFLTNTAVDDERVAFLYRAIVKVNTAGEYTFGYHGDDGFALRIGNNTWLSHTGGDGNRATLDFDDPRTLGFPFGTGDANVRGTMFLTPGEHSIELVSWEGVGGGSHELYWAKGTFANDAETNKWRLLGGPIDNVANIPSVTSAGWTVKTSAPGGSPIANISDAQADIAATGTEVTGIASINFTDPDAAGNAGSAPGDVPFLNNAPGDDDNFGAFASATLRIDVGETYRFQFRSDDGAWFRIVGETGWSNVFSLAGGNLTNRFSGTGLFDALQVDAPTGDSFTSGDIFLLPGEYQLEAGFFEIAGGASWEILAGDADSGELQLLAAGNNQALDGSVGQLQIVPEPTSVVMLLGGFGALLGFRRLRRLG